MSETKHTPGPWGIAPCSHGGAILTRGTDARTHPQSHIQVVPEADARLMAAAPDLLAALKGVREHALRSDSGWQEFIEEYVEPAISKAEGQS